MRLLYICWLVCSAALPASGQAEIEDLTMTELEYYNRAVRLEGVGQLDKALRIYSGFCQHDSLSPIAQKFKPRMDSMLDARYRYFHNNLQGRYRWLWSGSNWGTGNEPQMCCCERVMEIGKDSIRFYQDSLLQHAVAYSIKRAYINLELENWTIHLSNGENWLVSSTFEPYYHWRVHHQLRNTRDPMLWINRMQGCVCGCPEELYESLD